MKWLQQEWDNRHNQQGKTEVDWQTAGDMHGPTLIGIGHLVL
jgi:hypothetical protein